MKNRKELIVASLAFAAASLAFASPASAQCSECALYPSRDPFTQGLAITPAAPANDVASPAVPRSARNAHAQLRQHHAHHVASSARRQN
ncbi:hypothetical protein IC762_14880 [Bradyrhizobium genosp. L]|uniref:hypothetical protein n=1 Tax=Bradyrhizobium genosp. L TaxID=83637 RepID=UPI0018A3098F|nr:hypothetical protein [Bradyrhizobium genosp. L]QPF87489.1 hypothetical protein IC762_14880 [Bradyrhizobium genosp. L]